MEPVLIDQPTAAPTRKWTAATITQIVVVVLGLAAKFGFDLEVSPDDVTAVVTGFGILVGAAGQVVAYFTRDRAVPV